MSYSMASSLVPLSGMTLRAQRSSKCCISTNHIRHPRQSHLPHLYKRRTSVVISLRNYLFFSPLASHHKIKLCLSGDSDTIGHTDQGSHDMQSTENFKQWDLLTAKFAGAANVPFLVLQLPQIILNTRNIIAKNNSALFAVPWLGMLTGLLGNLSLLSYFIKKREKEAAVVQALGVVSSYVVLSQLAVAGAMPLPQFAVTSFAVACGLAINSINYFDFLNPRIWHCWEDFITIAGLSALPQVMWSTFLPFVPNTILPGVISFLVAVTFVLMARLSKLSEKGVEFVALLSAWTATLLFMWMPVAQMWTNILKPDNIKGLSAASMLLAMVGNGLMIPRALFTRDFMWFTGSSWACIFYGWGNLVCLYSFKVISRDFFLFATVGFIAWIIMAFWKDMQVYGYSSPLTSVKKLVSGSK
ncbi:unnamed protein product [Cuscuta europaea]|uniref:Uncharacterized protein n=1 Tax=Cuscuta europaea TaxID=41803 RepID=A0A9P0Z730_CUSEU|nr:unnamed protein product [Cuscuta europaea]